MLTNGKVEFEIKSFLWYYDPANNNDKIWGYVEIGGKVYNFWGRRADLSIEGKKKLNFKRWAGLWSTYDAERKAREKIRKGYREIGCSRTEDGEYPEIERVYKDFVKSFQNQLMFARLTGTVKGEEV